MMMLGVVAKERVNATHSYPFHVLHAHLLTTKCLLAVFPNIYYFTDLLMSIIPYLLLLVSRIHLSCYIMHVFNSRRHINPQ